MKARLALQALALLVVAAACAAASNALAGKERRLAWIGAPVKTNVGSPSATARPAEQRAAAAAPPTGSTIAPHPNTPFVEITGEETASLQARGDVPFLDARRTSVYRQGHIVAARPFSVWESDIDEKIKAFFAEGHDPSSPIVVYCSGGECEDSHTLAQKLYLSGFDAVFVYKDGFPDWQRRGLPVHVGDQP